MVQLRPPLFRGPPRIKPAGNHPTMKIVKCQMNKPSNKPYQKPKRRKQKITRQITGCKGIGIKLSVRMNIPAPNPYSFSCSLRCRHPLHLHKGRYSSGGESDRQDDWISEEVYRRYTETDSRPQSPEVSTTIISRKSASVTRSKSIEHRKCSTPEPETKQCVFHQRRVLVLDLRRVKSVDAIARQSSFTPATSFDDSTAADDEPDDNESSINPESSNLLSPRNLSVSRSVTPKNLKAVRRRRLKDRSNSPLEYERPTSPKILEGLTLPPLHSSVLTLLGQRPNSKLPSGSLSLPPGSLELNAEGFDEEASGIRMKQKLRRHGRKDKFDREDYDEDDLEGSAEGTRAPSPIPSLSASQDGAGSRRRSKILDDPHDTQVSVVSQRDDVDDLPKDDDRSSLGVGSLMDLRGRQFNSYILDNAKSLHEILDQELVGTEWNLGDMNHLDDKISQMKQELNEYETRFKAGNINMKEDLWLALPRTWSRSSATFGVPTDIRLLSKLHPLEYIEKYIFISEPRKLLYSLIFHRYRTMENPTGKTITYSCVPKALAEVLGRQVTENEKLRLEIDLLKIDTSNQEITENLFRGICAVTERVFGDYCLEDCNECFTCLRHPKKDKRRCHKNTRNQLEKVDLNYVATKIKEGKVNPLLSELLQTIFERHHP